MDVYYAGHFIITKSLDKGFYTLQGVGKPAECVARVSDAYINPYKDALWSTVEPPYSGHHWDPC